MPVFPDDVFRKPWEWRRVDRDEACFLCFRAKVVVLSRPGSVAPVVAEWLTPANALYSPNAAYEFRYLSYYVHEERDRDRTAPNAPNQPVEPEKPEEPQGIPAGEGPSHHEEPEHLPSDQESQAGTLTNAAKNHTPFTEICERQSGTVST